MAVVNAYYDLASVLLDRGADPNAPDPRGSALHSLVWMRKPGTSWEAAGTGVRSRSRFRVPTGKVTALQLGQETAGEGRGSERPHHLERDADDQGPGHHHESARTSIWAGIT